MVEGQGADELNEVGNTEYEADVVDLLVSDQVDSHSFNFVCMCLLILVRLSAEQTEVAEVDVLKEDHQEGSADEVFPEDDSDGLVSEVLLKLEVQVSDVFLEVAANQLIQDDSCAVFNHSRLVLVDVVYLGEVVKLAVNHVRVSSLPDLA